MMASNDRVYLEWDKFSAAEAGLFLWEAFVTGDGTASTNNVDDAAAIAVEGFSATVTDPTTEQVSVHIRDARAVVKCFTAALTDLTSAITVPCSLSLVGTAALWSGWCDDVGLLHTPCVVLKASKQP
jgi:hypothetical protein